MQTFNILGHQICFDDKLTIYANIHKKSIEMSSDFQNKYNIIPNDISTVEELTTYIENITNLMNDELQNTTDEILNILVSYQIYDKSSKDITANCKSIYEFNLYMNKIKLNINDFINSINQYKSNMENKAATMVSDAIDDGCVSVLTTSVTTSIVTDLLNEKWHREGDKKRQKAYNHMMKDLDVEISNKIKNFSLQFQTTMKEDINNYGISIIKEMFNFCVSILISENKLPSSILDNLQEEKAINISNNCERIQDENLKQNQLIIALQTYPFLENIHAKIIEFMDNFTDDYIKLVKFLKCENIILNICIKNCSNITSEDNKYMKLRKIFDTNNMYYQKHVDNIFSNNKTFSPSYTQEISKNIYRFTDTETIYIDNEYNYIFDVFVYASYSIGGTITTQDRTNGHIIINRPLSIWQMTPSTTLEIQIIKIDDKKSKVTVSTLAKTKNFLCSPLVWKHKLLKKAKTKL